MEPVVLGASLPPRGLLPRERELLPGSVLSGKAKLWLVLGEP